VLTWGKTSTSSAVVLISFWGCKTLLVCFTTHFTRLLNVDINP
jgi:hypothetical protein